MNYLNTSFLRPYKVVYANMFKVGDAIFVLVVIIVVKFSFFLCYISNIELFMFRFFTRLVRNLFLQLYKINLHHIFITSVGFISSNEMRKRTVFRVISIYLFYLNITGMHQNVIISALLFIYTKLNENIQRFSVNRCCLFLFCGIITTINDLNINIYYINIEFFLNIKTNVLGVVVSCLLWINFLLYKYKLLSFSLDYWICLGDNYIRFNMTKYISIYLFTTHSVLTVRCKHTPLSNLSRFKNWGILSTNRALRHHND